MSRWNREVWFGQRRRTDISSFEEKDSDKTQFRLRFDKDNVYVELTKNTVSGKPNVIEVINMNIPGDEFARMLQEQFRRKP